MITGSGGGRSGGQSGPGGPGGSGGGSGLYSSTKGCGNVPPFDPPQGNDGGAQPGPSAAPASGGNTSGGGGATAAGGSFPASQAGGAGAPNLINCGGVPGFSITTFSGGGGGGGPVGSGGGSGGAGGGGNGGTSATDGTANTGGGAGGRSNQPCGVPGFSTGMSGGSGVVIVRTPSKASLSVSPGTNATATHPGGDKIAVFTVSGTLTIS